MAAKKAFVTNRIGDFGFMIALFLMFGHFHSFNYSAVLAPLSAGHATLTDELATGLGLMLFLGAVGKSAQIPLYMWLPDAMEGPTPVSALIHAATMVTAGVYLMARSAPIFHFSSSTQWIDRHHRRGHRPVRRHHRLRPGRHQAGAGLLDHLPARLHVPGRGRGRLLRRASTTPSCTPSSRPAVPRPPGAVIHALHDEQNMKRMGGLCAIPAASPS